MITSPSPQPIQRASRLSSKSASHALLHSLRWGLLAALLSLTANHGNAAGTLTFEPLPGRGTDISVGANGTAWMIGFDENDKDREIFRWTGSVWEPMPGRGTRIAVDPQGNAWMLDEDGEVRHWENAAWADKPGRGSDIAVGANGDVWMVGFYNDIFDTDRNPENRKIYRWTGTDWQEIDGGAVRIAVAPDGTPWIIDENGSILERRSGSWFELDGRALDIGIGSDGTVWISILREWDEDGELARRENNQWAAKSTSSRAIGVDPTGMPWFTVGSGELFRGTSYELRLSQPIVRNGNIEFSFPTLMGATYSVRLRQNLNVAPTTLQQIPGTGGAVSFTNTPPAGTIESYYDVLQN